MHIKPGPIKYSRTNCRKFDEWTHIRCTIISLSEYNKLSTSGETLYNDCLSVFTKSVFHDTSIRSRDTEFSNIGSSECEMFQQNAKRFKKDQKKMVMVRVMVFNVTFNNISVISWRWDLLVEETGVFGENHRSVASHWQTLSHNVVSSTPRHEQDSNSQR